MPQLHLAGVQPMSPSLVRVNTRTTGVWTSTVAMQSMFEATGDVGKAAKRAGRLIRHEAEAIAPVRSGELAASHTGPKTPTTFLGVHVVVGNNAAHAKFVHNGTTGPIRATRHPQMVVRPAPHSWYSEPTYRDAVRGQRAQPWLRDAMYSVVALIF